LGIEQRRRIVDIALYKAHRHAEIGSQRPRGSDRRSRKVEARGDRTTPR
jgi:hypothetical protein